jgi:uncharacterized protein
MLLAIRVYQMFFSAWMPSACKFYPSCSQYAANAIQIHGARHGSWLALRRLARCHPFTRGGVDLVPDSAECPRHGNATGETPILECAEDTGAGCTTGPPKYEVHS